MVVVGCKEGDVKMSEEMCVWTDSLGSHVDPPRNMKGHEQDIQHKEHVPHVQYQLKKPYSKAWEGGGLVTNVSFFCGPYRERCPHIGCRWFYSPKGPHSEDRWCGGCTSRRHSWLL